MGRYGIRRAIVSQEPLTQEEVHGFEGACEARSVSGGDRPGTGTCGWGSPSAKVQHRTSPGKGLGYRLSCPFCLWTRQDSSRHVAWSCPWRS